MGGLIRTRTKGITSSVKIVANIFISFIGAGLLGLPYAFKEAGVVEGAIIMTVVGYLSTSAMLMLIDCKYAILAAGGRPDGRGLGKEKKDHLLHTSSDDDDASDTDDGIGVLARSSDLTYGDVGMYAYGAAGKRLVDVAVVVSQVGFCCGYLIYLCKNMSVYAPILSQHQWLLVILPPLYALTLLRHLNKLAVFSLFAQVSNVFALTVVFWFDFSHVESVPFVPKVVSLKGLPFFFSVAIYCYEGAGLILSMEESVAEKKRPKFRIIFIVNMIALTVLYVCFGASGYISFGPHTEDIITLNLPHGDSIVDFAALVKVCLGISLFFTYPIMMFPVSHLLDKTCNLHSTTRGNFVRLLMVITTGLVVLVIPNFGVLISLIGATCCTLLAFILPALFHLKIFRSRITKQQWYFNMLLISLGSLGAVVGLCDTFTRIGNDSRVTVDELSHNAGPHGDISMAATNVSAHLALDNGSPDFGVHSNNFDVLNGSRLEGTLYPPRPFVSVKATKGSDINGVSAAKDSDRDSVSAAKDSDRSSSSIGEASKGSDRSASIAATKDSDSDSGLAVIATSSDVDDNSKQHRASAVRDNNKNNMQQQQEKPRQGTPSSTAQSESKQTSDITIDEKIALVRKQLQQLEHEKEEDEIDRLHAESMQGAAGVLRSDEPSVDYMLLDGVGADVALSNGANSAVGVGGVSDRVESDSHSEVSGASDSSVGSDASSGGSGGDTNSGGSGDINSGNDGGGSAASDGVIIGDISGAGKVDNVSAVSDGNSAVGAASSSGVISASSSVATSTNVAGNNTGSGQ